MINKLKNKRNPIIVTYSEALSEKVVSRKELKKHTISLKTNDRISMEDLEKMLQNLNFEKVDFIIARSKHLETGFCVPQSCP